MLPASSYCRNEITVSEKVFVVSNSSTVKPRINLETISKSTDYLKNVCDEPWIATRVNRCIDDNTLGTEITEPQFCVFINDCTRSGNRYVFCVSDGRTKIPFITSSNISENLNLYYNQQINWTGYIILINTYRLILMDANFVIESENYILLEFDEDACNIIKKRMKWLKWSECIPHIANLMKDKLGVEAYIPDDQKIDWRDILISNKEAVNEIESESSNISDEDVGGSSLPSSQKIIFQDKNTSPLSESVQKAKTTPEKQFNGDSLISYNNSVMTNQNSLIELPMTSTPQSNVGSSVSASKFRSLLKGNLSCILKTKSHVQTNCKEVNSSPKEVNLSSKEVNSSLKEVNSSPKEVDSSPEDVNSSPKEVNSSPKEVNSSPEDVNSSPKEVNSSFKEVNSSPKEVNSSPKEVNSSPKEVNSSPKEVNSFPKEVNLPPDVVKRLPENSIRQKKSSEETTLLRLSDTGTNGEKLKKVDPTCKLVMSETITCDLSPDVDVLLNLSAEVVLEPSKIQELRKLKYIRDKDGKLYKLVIESQSEMESSCEEEEIDVEVPSNSESEKVKSLTETSDELMEIGSDEDDEIENSQEELVPKIQSSIRRLGGQSDVNQNISIPQPQNLFPMILHVDHGKQNCKKVQIGSAECSNKLSRQVLNKSWRCVSKMTLNSGHDTEKLIKIVQKQRTNPNEFKRTFLTHLNSVLNRDKL